MQQELISGLTEPQRQAVTHMDGPILVLAGPGSGKTRVITHRVAWLITQGISPRNILAITFTNKAAREMRDRVHSLRVPRGSTICTFHSLAARLLREFADHAGLPADFSIYGDADQRTAMRESLKLCELDAKNFPPAKILTRVSGWKNKFLGPDQLDSRELDYFDKVAARLYGVYQEYLKANSALDFDDLLMRLALLLRDDPELRDHLNDRFRYVMVDEYQDTNHCQYQIARGFTVNHSNICATGDPDQSIYGWRGADIGNILAFERDYPQAVVVRLEENFRSTPEVLDLADQVIRINRQRKEKRLFTSKSSGDPCELREYYDESEEALGMAQWIAQMRKDGLQYRVIAVFYRINAMSRVLEEALRRAHIPYQIIRGTEFFKRREIRDMLAYLRLLANPSDQVALRRIINQPARGIGATTVNRLFDHSSNTGGDIWQVLQSLDQVPAINAGARAKVKKFVDMIMKLREQMGSSVERVMKLTYEWSGLAKAHAADESDDPAANVDELINSAALYDTEAEEPLLSDYLQQIALISDADAYNDQAGAVSLMTLHAAKGLEFPAVLIVGLEDGLIPHRRYGGDESDVEEERRLLFVGMTRAEDRLVLSYARNRMVHGSSQAGIISVFLRDLTGLVCNTDTADDGFDDDDDDDGYSQSDHDDVLAECAALARGQLVRHPEFGLGRVQRISNLSDNPKVVVQFNTGACKTLYLKYAHLERIDSTDF